MRLNYEPLQPGPTLPATGQHCSTAHAAGVLHAGSCLHLGLVNNMPAAAREATESQFLSLLQAAAGDMCVHVSLFTLGTAASWDENGKSHRYQVIDALWGRSLDALIVTGAEPTTSNLMDEPYWATLARLVRWASEHTLSTIWSCLAAHAAVLASDGIPRHRQRRKQFGVFRCMNTHAHTLMIGLPNTFPVPHSRWNSLDGKDLTGAGYVVLSRSSAVGVDIFVKQQQSLFVFMQGHPEYDADTLLREYRRDLLRHIRGMLPVPPQLPSRYFDPASESLLRACVAAPPPRSGESFFVEAASILKTARTGDGWHTTARMFYRNWLTHILKAKASAQVDHKCMGSSLEHVAPSHSQPAVCATAGSMHS